MIQIFSILIIALLMACACSMSGLFLVLRKRVLVGDAVSHSMLLGIILAFLVTQNLHSPLLIFGASIAVFLTLYGVEYLNRLKPGFPDAIIASVYPSFFALAILIIYQTANNVHLDQDVVLLGELAFAPFNTFTVRSLSLGPIAVWSGAFCVFLNILLVCLFHRQIRFAIFDPDAAQLAGFRLNYIFMFQSFVLCLTSVAAFDAVGVILVLALMVLPVVSAKLLSISFWPLFYNSLLFAAVSVCFGIVFAFSFDLNIAASIVLVNGIIFFGLLGYQYLKKSLFRLY